MFISSLFFFCAILVIFPFVVRGQNATSRCHDATWIFFVSEMFLVKASRPTRCHLLSLSCLSHTSALMSPVVTTFLSLPRFFLFSSILSALSLADSSAVPPDLVIAIDPRLQGAGRQPKPRVLSTNASPGRTQSKMNFKVQRSRARGRIIRRS